MQVLGEAVVRGDNKLERVCRRDGEGMHFHGANLGEPEEAVLAGLGTLGGLLEDDLRSAVRKRVDGCRVVEAVQRKADQSDNAVEHPDAAGDDDRVDHPLGRLGLVEA